MVVLKHCVNNTFYALKYHSMFLPLIQNRKYSHYITDIIKNPWIFYYNYLLSTVTDYSTNVMIRSVHYLCGPDAAAGMLMSFVIEVIFQSGFQFRS